MATNRYFLDVDALCKLAHWNILQLLPEILGCTWGNFSTMASLRYRAAASVSSPDKKLFHSQDAARIAMECIEQMSSLGAPDPGLLASLSDVPQIDPGEAVLMAMTACQPNSFFITGDKRAIRAVADHAISAQLAGRVLCIEQIVKRCLTLKGRQWVLANMCPQRDRDKAVSMVLGSQCDASNDNLIEGLDSYINQLRTLSDPSLLSGE